MDIVKDFIKKFRELFDYVIVGGLTTLVNFVVYFSCTHVQMNWFIANMIAWVFAVAFAYFANRIYVFKSDNKDKKKELMLFILLRLLTLGIESILMFICIQLLLINENIAKILVSIVTVLGNYVFCKFFIFNES